MDRKEFISMVGFGSISVFAAACLGGCNKNDISSLTAAPSNVDFTLDLTQSANATLLVYGGYLYSGGVIVARTIAGNYIAVSQACTHQGVTVQYIGSSQEFYCPSHGATFSNTGAVTGGPAPGALKKYNTSLNGSMLRVYS
jgi:cytochrome b6-f complex iron-sulfur subunit